MRRKKTVTEPVWLTWEGDYFPRSYGSDSLVFYLSEHIYLDADEIAKKSLAREIQREGIVSSLFEAYRLIEISSISRAGFYYEDGDDRFPIYCDESNENYEWDATYVEVPYAL